MTYEVKAIVEFNSGIAYVLDRPVEFKYYREGNLIIGLDDTCTFVRTYIYDRPSAGFEAFGGSKFDITLENGEVIHCHGQWWDGGIDKAAKLLGDELVRVTFDDIESLKNCFVFTGNYAIKSSLEQLRQTYTGKIYGYWEYEAILKGREAPIR